MTSQSVPPQKIQNFVIERAGLLPRHGVAGVVNNGPFVMAQMRGPDAHQGRRRQKIGVGGDHQRRRGDGGDLGKRVRRAQRRLKARARLARVLVDLDPAPGALRIGAAIGRADLPVMRRLFPDLGDGDAGDEIGDLLVLEAAG
jgi:hypothetical protein